MVVAAADLRVGAHYARIDTDDEVFFDIEYRGQLADGRHIFHGGVDFYLAEAEITSIEAPA